MRAGNDLIYALLAQRAWEGSLEACQESLALFERRPVGDPMTVWVGEAKGRIGRHSG
jgi:hypothetical protein